MKTEPFQRTMRVLWKGSFWPFGENKWGNEMGKILQTSGFWGKMIKQEALRHKCTQNKVISENYSFSISRLGSNRPKVPNRTKLLVSQLWRVLQKEEIKRRVGQKRGHNHMCATDTGSGQRQEPGLGFNISKESVFQGRVKKVCVYAPYMYHCLLYAMFDAWPV